MFAFAQYLQALERVCLRVTAAARPGSGTGVVSPPRSSPLLFLLLYVVLVVLVFVVIFVADGDFLEVAKVPIAECVLRILETAAARRGHSRENALGKADR